MAMLWTLGYSDGCATLLDIADRADLDFAQVCTAAADLAGAGLLERAGEHPGR
jgi:aminopeptidase-like protein